MMHSSQSKPGFTLVETLIVLAIVAAVAALVLPGTLSQLRYAKFDEATRQVILAADACRSQAISHASITRLVLTHNTAGDTLTMERDPPSDSSSETSSDQFSGPTSGTPSSTSAPSSNSPPSLIHEELYVMPQGISLAIRARSDQADRAETSGDAAAEAASNTNAADASSADRVVLASFLPDGSLFGSVMELKGPDLKVQFTPILRAGRFTMARVDAPADASADGKPSPSDSSEKSSATESSTGNSAAPASSTSGGVK